jgi:hypothetical protein
MIQPDLRLSSFMTDTIVLGHGEAFWNTTEYNNLKTNTNKIAMMQMLIKKQAKQTPKIVGEPIDIILIKRNGQVTWYPNKRNECK